MQADLYVIMTSMTAAYILHLQQGWKVFMTKTKTSNKLYMQKEMALFFYSYKSLIVRDDGIAARILHLELLDWCD